MRVAEYFQICVQMSTTTSSSTTRNRSIVYERVRVVTGTYSASFKTKLRSTSVGTACYPRCTPVFPPGAPSCSSSFSLGTPKATNFCCSKHHQCCANFLAKRENTAIII
ncbi:unnamed protein product [Amoebophrya sp. A120]|nr:unnamed protein product [Amoebophrya sp. A120]|eukprot:GSA120T00024882001.1